MKELHPRAVQQAASLDYNDYYSNFMQMSWYWVDEMAEPEFLKRREAAQESVFNVHAPPKIWIQLLTSPPGADGKSVEVSQSCRTEKSHGGVLRNTWRSCFLF